MGQLHFGFAETGHFYLHLQIVLVQSSDVRIKYGELAAGDVIPSRLTVKQALYKLRVEGYVIPEKGLWHICWWIRYRLE
jgi:hypothetical protein